MSLLDQVISCYDSITPLLQSVAESGTSPAKVSKLEEFKNNLIKILDEIPALLSNHEDASIQEMLKFTGEIEQARKIIEICITIINEFQSGPNFQKLQSLMFTWTHVSSIAAIPIE